MGGSIPAVALAKELFPEPGGPMRIAFGILITGSYICQKLLIWHKRVLSSMISVINVYV